MKYCYSASKNKKLVCECGELFTPKKQKRYDVTTEGFYLAFSYLGANCPECGTVVLDRATQLEILGDP